MDKRSLAKTERPVVTKRISDFAALVPMVKYVVSVQEKEIGGKDTLILNFFLNEEGEVKPAFRSFLQAEDYISQDLTTDKTKWKTGAVNILTGSLYGKKIAVASVVEKKLAIRFLSNILKERCPKRVYTKDKWELETKIDDYQDSVKEERLERKHDREVARVEAIMESFGELPTDYDDFVRDTVFDDFNFIFYSRSEKRAYCSRCGKMFKLTRQGTFKNGTEKLKHNTAVVCPKCGKPTTCKSEGMGRSSLHDIKWSVYVETAGEEVHTRYFCSTKDMRRDYKHPVIRTGERIRTVHTEKESKDYEWRTFYRGNTLHWLPFKEKSYGLKNPTEYEVPRSMCLYNPSLENETRSTWLKYSGLDVFVKEGVEKGNKYPWAIDWYINYYRNHKHIEQIVKVGLYELAREIIGMKEYSYRYKDGLELVDGRTICETLGISRSQFKVFRGLVNASAEDLKIIRYAGEITENELLILRKWQLGRYDNVYEKMLGLKAYGTLVKFDRYLTNQGVEDPHDYFDYIEWLEKMKYDMRNKSNLFPKEFEKAHDRLSALYQSFLDKEKKKERARFNRVLKKMRKNTEKAEPMNLKIGGIFIRLPINLDELKKEGESLHHCVATYQDKVVKGETMIFFIRKVEEPDKPFYTLEWKGKIIQCHGMKNCEPTPEVKAFISVFDEKMKDYADSGKLRKVG